MQQMGWLSSILSGVPGTPGQTVTSAQPGLPSQLASLGLTGASLANLFGGGSEQ